MPLFPMYDENRDYSGVMQAAAAARRNDPYDDIKEEAAVALWRAVRSVDKTLLNVFTPVELCRLFYKTVEVNLHLTGSDRIDTSYFESMLKRRGVARTAKKLKEFETEIRRNHRIPPALDATENEPEYTFDFVKSLASKVESGKNLSALEKKCLDEFKF